MTTEPTEKSSINQINTRKILSNVLRSFFNLYPTLFFLLGLVYY
jgi:hypothetical protein